VLRLIESGILIPYMLFSIPIIAILAHSVTKVFRMRHEERMARGSISPEDAAQWQRTVERLEARMKTLETILDDQVPGWRRKYDD
jgi:phage shock protein B